MVKTKLRAPVASLNTAGYELSYAELRERHQGNVNRAVIAAELLRKGYMFMKCLMVPYGFVQKLSAWKENRI